MQLTIEGKKEFIKEMLNRNLLVSEGLFNLTSQSPIHEKETRENVLNKTKKHNLLVVGEEIASALKTALPKSFDWPEFEKSKASFEKGKNIKTYERFRQYLAERQEHPAVKVLEEEDEEINNFKRRVGVRTIFSYDEAPVKRDAQQFTDHFTSRYKSIERILRTRKEMQGAISIARIHQKKDRERVAFIGMIKDKAITKNNNIILELEDTSGEIRTFITTGKQEIHGIAKEEALDSVIGVTGHTSNKVVFATDLVLPDIPQKELKKSPTEEYAAFISDLHVGSNNFLSEKFDKFLKWINGRVGSSSQKEIVNKIRYVFIMGDLVDGVGVYPGQEKELIIKGISQQYAECSKLLKEIPENIPLIICPGNHDATRISEPQLPPYKDFSLPLWKLPNAILTSNPSYINIGATSTFPGFDILMYHGYSFDYYIANTDSIRAQGGYDRADLIMRYLLKRRHLAPTHASTLYIPDARADHLVIDRIPDFFVTGHIHKASISNYRNTTLICGSCWQSTTGFQEKVGHHPEPGRVPVVNLKSRAIKVLKF